MPIGVYDIRDREPVYHPSEIEAGRLAAEQKGLDYITGDNARAVPLAQYVERLTKRWQRAVGTMTQVRAIQDGYCTIAPKASPQPSDARH